MSASWKTAAIVGVGAAAFFGVLALLTRKSETEPSWRKLVLESDGKYRFLPDRVYVVSGPTEGMPVDTSVIQRELKAEGLTVLEITKVPPKGLPLDEVRSGFAYMLFTPDRELTFDPQFPRPVYVLG